MPEQLEMIDARSALESTVSQVILSADPLLSLCESVGFCVLSTNDAGKYVMPADEEQILSPRACEQKRLQFASGRAAARLALEHAGLEKPPSILQGTGGEPLWPVGFVGSITHCDSWSVAVALKCTNHCVIGIDLESVAKTSGTDISDLICGGEEIHWLRSAADCKERLAMIFSAKEAVYKAFYPLCRRYVDFKEALLSWFPKTSSFRGKFLKPSGDDSLPDNHFEVHCRRFEDWVFSIVMHTRI